MRAIYERYRGAGRRAKGAVLDEFCRSTDYNRKYAIRLLSGPPPDHEPVRRVRRRERRYGQQTVSILAAVWEAAGYPWSARLRALSPLWMPWIRRRFRPSRATERQLLSISPCQMDRRLRDRKSHLRRRIYGRTKPGTLLKRQVPIKTDSWDVKTPGFAEIDLVSHSGNPADREFAHSVDLTDIHTTRTESPTALGHGQAGVQAALEETERGLPFALRGLDSDNGSEFINWHLMVWRERRRIQLTRGRAYRKDDDAHIEQQNWTHVRKLLGWSGTTRPRRSRRSMTSTGTSCACG
ncbi:MAG TPA: hypothetical protein VGS20_08015 [Candidatus Acidoferrales bacterium]|nr:hypothetical protein [Candidatus Acidoferrales bacterium]